MNGFGYAFPITQWWKRSRGREGPLRIQRKGNAGGGARHMYGTRGENIKREKVCVKCETEGGRGGLSERED